jgi:hypothetical protein
LYCIKLGCGSTAAGASFIAGGMASDALLVESGRERVFLPMMGKLYTGVFGEAPNNKTYNTTGGTTLIQTPNPNVGIVKELVMKYHNMSA